jgi:hypothetical protein
MSTTTNRFARYIALPAIAAGIIGGAALGLAGTANAGTYPQHDQTPQPGMVAVPHTYANGAPEAVPGHHWHHGVWHLGTLEPTYTR